MKDLWKVFQDVLSILPAEAVRFLRRYSFSLSVLSIFDALALALLAITMNPMVTGRPLVLPIFGQISAMGLLVMLGVVCLLMITKGLFAVLLLRRATSRFARYELALGGRLFESFIRAPWVERLKRNSSDMVRMVDSSVGSTIANFLLPGASLPGEGMTFLVIVVVLAIAKPLVAVTGILYLTMVGAFLFFWISRKAREAGRVSLHASRYTSRIITEMIGALKEVTLRNKLSEVAGVVERSRVRSSRARANMQFLSQIPRYVLESAIVGGFVLVGAVGYASGGIPATVAAVGLFGLAGFRLAPSIIRFQAITSQMISNAPHAVAVVRDIRQAESAASAVAPQNSLDLPEDPRSLIFEHVSFDYLAGGEPAVRDISLKIPFGSTVAFVGSSGAGKSTMIDLILGLIEPSKGQIRVDDVSLKDVTESWRGRVGYVPQDVSLFDASIAENVALTWSGEIDRDLVRECLATAQLLDFIESREGGIDGAVGEKGLALSGGQRQRLGIARALYSQPLILVMDEATSALDTATEAAVSTAIASLHGETTVVLVAHRLATVQHADEVFFMSGGRIEASGTFTQLVKRVPEFAAQARLAGLTTGEL
jgi:ABC-type multidrug transport system fused ATPase/permease subunit